MSAVRQPKALEMTRPAKTPTPKAMRLVRTPRPARPLAITVLVLIALIALSLYYVPWQQSAIGYGKTMIFSPMERPQSIEAQISGRIKRWGVVDGQVVKAGDVIAELAETDVKFLDPNQLRRLESQREILMMRREAAELRAASLTTQMGSLGKSREAAVPAANERARQTEDRLRAAEQSVRAAREKLRADQLNFERIRDLNQGRKGDNGEWAIQPGLRSDRDFELARQTLEMSKADVERLEATLEAAKKDMTVGGLDATRVENDTAAGISSVQASLASAKETIASINNDLQKLEIDIQNFQQRIEQRQIKSPRGGQVTQLKKIGEGETVKSGDILCTIVPTVQTSDQAVEVFVSDFDAPLVRVGDPVRLQFDGWPAVQFVGWPSVAIGTFAGQVYAVDAVDDGNSQYRVIVKPDTDLIAKGKEEQWPSPSVLRPGTQSTGWVMLRRVSLGFELWRQFNGFPAARSPMDADKKGGGSKPKEKEKSKSEEKDEK